MSLKSNDIQTKLKGATRHQPVTVYGKILAKDTPQQHILIDKIELGERWDPKVKFQYNNQPRIADLNKHLKEKTEILGTVHALLHEGKVLLVNYGGHAIPVHIQDPQLTKDLWSSDKIRLRFQVRNHSEGPPHLSLHSEKGVAPIEVIESMTKINGKERQIEGALVWFPKSPATAIEVWGIEEKDTNGVSRIYALFNFEDEKDLQKIDTLLRDAWNKKKEGFISRAGTSFYHPNIRLQLKGTVNQFARNQGNAVIDLKSEDIKLLPSK